MWLCPPHAICRIVSGGICCVRHLVAGESAACQSRPALGAFTLGVLPAFAVQSYVNYVLSDVARPGGLSFDAPLVVMVRRLFEALTSLHATNYIWTFWIPGRAMPSVSPMEGGALRWQLGLTVMAVAFLVISSRGYRRGGLAASDPRNLALGLLVAVPAILVVARVFENINFVAVERYYSPVIPLSVFYAYSTASADSVAGQRTALNLLKTCGTVYVTAFIATSTGAHCVSLHTWPNRHVPAHKARGNGPAVSVVVVFLHELSPARQLVLRLVEKDPEALVMTSRRMTFIWDPKLDRSRLLSLSCDAWQGKHVMGPASIIIHTFDLGQPEEMWSYRGESSGPVRVHCLQELSDLSVVQRFPDEGLKS